MESSFIENIYEINVDFSIPEEEKKSFHTIFTYIRKKLQLKLARKNNIDSLLKKCKGKFCKAVFESIKLCLNLKVQRLPQEFITNITIEYNQNFLHKKIIDIYNEFNLLPSLEEIINKNLCRKGKIEIFKEIANSDFSSLYDNYITSDRFKRDYENLIKEEGKRKSLLYEFVAKNFCVYYFFGEGHSVKEKIVNDKNCNKNEKKKILFKISSCNKNNPIYDKNKNDIKDDLNKNLFDN
jgi:hypothetical protein